MSVKDTATETIILLVAACVGIVALIYLLPRIIKSAFSGLDDAAGAVSDKLTFERNDLFNKLDAINPSSSITYAEFIESSPPIIKEVVEVGNFVTPDFILEDKVQEGYDLGNFLVQIYL